MFKLLKALFSIFCLNSKMFLFCCHFWALIIRLDFFCVNQIELQEQRSSGRGNKSKDSKRKRKSQKTEGGPKSTEASECKKTKPVSLTPPSDPHRGTHSKLNWSQAHALFMRTVRNKQTCSSLADLVMFS